MGKLIATVLATLCAMFFIGLAFGGSLSKTAFHITSLNWSVSYWALTCGVVGFAIWRIVKGK